MNYYYDYLTSYLNQLRDNFHLDSTTVLKAIGLCVFGLGAKYFLSIINSYRFFKKRGIKNADYRFFYGNFDELYKNKVDLNKEKSL